MIGQIRTTMVQLYQDVILCRVHASPVHHCVLPCRNSRPVVRIALRILFIFLTLYNIMDERNLSEELLSSEGAAESDVAELLATSVKGIAGQVMIIISNLCSTLY